MVKVEEGDVMEMKIQVKIKGLQCEGLNWFSWGDGAKIC